MPDDSATNSERSTHRPCPPMVSFAAPSGTGKTTLLEGVVAELGRRGHHVAVVKHDAHRIELDTEGKDSWRLRQAGARSTLLMGRDQLAWFGADGAGPSLEQAVALFHGEADIVLVEGYRSAGLPTVLVERHGFGDGNWERPDPALVLSSAHPDDVGPVADLLERRFLS